MLHGLHLYFILHYLTFACAWSSPALDATLHDLHLRFMLRYLIFTSIGCYAGWAGWGRGGDYTKPVSCSAARSSLPSLALDAPLLDLCLRLMLGFLIFTCIGRYATWYSFALDATQGRVGGWGGANTKPASCFATWFSFALDATLLDRHLHLVLRNLIFASKTDTLADQGF